MYAKYFFEGCTDFDELMLSYLPATVGRTSI
jgi:hypothetical protein